MGFADEWYLHPLTPEWEREMVAEGMGIEKERARRLAEKGELPIQEVVRWCSEGREKRKVADIFNFDDKKVLEVGCGRGYYTQFLAEESKSVCALDKMAGNRINHMWEEFKNVIEGNKVWNKVLPVQADARGIPVPDNAFDLATCAAFFRDLHPHNIQKEVIEEMARVSRGLRIAVYVDKNLDRAQQNYYNQLALRKEAQKALDIPEEHFSHVPFEPSEVKSWFEGIVDTSRYDYFDPDLKGEWGGNVQYYIDELDDSHPEKGELADGLEKLNKYIDKYGCKRPTIMLIWA